MRAPRYDRPDPYPIIMPEIPKLPPIADQPLSVILLARNRADHVALALTTWLASSGTFRAATRRSTRLATGPVNRPRRAWATAR